MVKLKEYKMTVSYKRQQVGEVEVFYREAGTRTAPVLLLLHGFPSSSHMFRDLIPLLAERYHVIAPDLPGFGYTRAPERGKFDYTFDNLAKVMEGFTEALGLERYALYVFDYGAPTGFRLALAHPERITQSLARMVTRISMVSATSGGLGRLIGATQLRRPERPAGLHFLPR
ncbi:alpha/beta fold hydrolase [Bradyrhizobium lupini]|uniref:alpha/beta fold hydrolase n=1 Tax=Rhizobium lupini TaxID=136996 RepID=UPI00387E1F86